MWNPFRKKYEPAKVFAANYYLAFDFIANMVDSYNQDASIKESILGDIKYWKKNVSIKNDDMFQLDWKNTTCVHKNAKDGDYAQFVLINFSPIGAVPTAPKAGFIFIDKIRHHASYYTLEHSFGSDVICQMDNGTHLNFGSVPYGDNDLYSFMKRAMEIEGIKL